MKSLPISKDLALPIDAVTQTFAAIARKGAGKTYFATKLAELMLGADAQVIAIDPVGNWYGLRLAADGSHAGLPIYVFGGEHGDIPISPESGRKVAALVVEKRISAVLDVSSFRKGERERFAAEFAEEFFHRKKSQRSPVHLFIEEAQKFIPQMCGPEERKMLGAFEDIVRLGRNYGIGATLVSQRPQSVNKEVLSQVECLVTLQINGVHERKAIDAWVSEHGLDRGLLGELPGLAVGEAFIWSPSWLRAFCKTRIERKLTFDASATPTVGQKIVKPAELSPVDLKSLQADMSAEIERAKADDPKELRLRIRQLETELKKASSAAPAPPDAEVIKTAYERGFREGLRDTKGTLGNVSAILAAAVTQLSSAKEGIEAFLATPLAKPELVAPARPRPDARPNSPTPVVRENRATETGSRSGDLTGPEQRILNAIAWLENIGIAQPEQTAVAFLAGYTIGGGAFNNPRGRLRVSGLIEYRGDRIELTDAGRKLAEFPRQPLTPEELQRQVMERLPGPEQKILRVLLECYPKTLPSDECARRAGYEPGGGAFNNPRGRLRTMGLIEYPQPGQLRARGLLFLEDQ